MACCGVQVGDSLTVTLTLLECGTNDPVDISTQTGLEIVLLGPGSIRLAQSASLVTDGTDGKMTADFASGTITASGEWKVQGNVTLSAPAVYHTEVKTFPVHANI